MPKKRATKRVSKRDKTPTHRQRKTCQFCKDGATGVDFKDAQLLRKFISDRGKIRSRRVSGACVQHQRDIATAIKVAREVALLPYMTK